MKKLVSKKILISLITMGFLFIPQIVLGATPGIQQYKELVPFVNFVHFLINIIRWGAGSVAGLYTAVTGWHVLNNKNGLDVAKKDCQRGFYALLFIFGGTTVADFFVGKLASIFLS